MAGGSGSPDGLVSLAVPLILPVGNLPIGILPIGEFAYRDFIGIQYNIFKYNSIFPNHDLGIHPAGSPDPDPDPETGIMGTDESGQVTAES